MSIQHVSGVVVDGGAFASITQSSAEVGPYAYTSGGVTTLFLVLTTDWTGSGPYYVQIYASTNWGVNWTLVTDWECAEYSYLSTVRQGNEIHIFYIPTSASNCEFAHRRFNMATAVLGAEFMAADLTGWMNPAIAQPLPGGGEIVLGGDASGGIAQWCAYDDATDTWGTPVYTPYDLAPTGIAVPYTAGIIDGSGVTHAFRTYSHSTGVIRPLFRIQDIYYRQISAGLSASNPIPVYSTGNQLEMILGRPCVIGSKVFLPVQDARHLSPSPLVVVCIDNSRNPPIITYEYPDLGMDGLVAYYVATCALAVDGKVVVFYAVQNSDFTVDEIRAVVRNAAGLWEAPTVIFDNVGTPSGPPDAVICNINAAYLGSNKYGVVAQLAASDGWAIYLACQEPSASRGRWYAY